MQVPFSITAGESFGDKNTCGFLMPYGFHHNEKLNSRKATRTKHYQNDQY